jgi:predicted nucleic acid-binding protein
VTRSKGRLVVDASAVAALLLPDEADPPVFGDLSHMGLDAPWLFWAELRNILIVSERRSRLPAGSAERLLGAADGLRIRLHADPSEAAVLRLAWVHGLSVYDALYLDLGLRLDAPLMTLDGRLAAAARAEGCALGP